MIQRGEFCSTEEMLTKDQLYFMAVRVAPVMHGLAAEVLLGSASEKQNLRPPYQDYCLGFCILTESTGGWKAIKAWEVPLSSWNCNSDDMLCGGAGNPSGQGWLGSKAHVLLSPLLCLLSSDADRVWFIAEMQSDLPGRGLAMATTVGYILLSSGNF